MDFLALAEKSQNQPEKSKSINQAVLLPEVFESGMRFLQNSGIPELDDETTTVWYAAVQDIPEPVFQEAVRMIIQGKLKPDDYASSTERTIPALIRQHWESGKERRARQARMQKQRQDQIEMETMERPTLEQVKAFNEQLKNGGNYESQ